MRDIGKNIRQLRVKRKLTQDELAERLFVTRQTVSNYETGRSRPDVELLAKIADVLETDVNTLIYGEQGNNISAGAKKQMLFAMLTTAGLYLLYFLLLGPARKLQYNLYITGPLLFVQYILLPLCYVFLAWTVMRGIGLLTKAKPIQSRHTKYLRRTVYVLLLLYFVLMLPTVYHGIKSLLVKSYVDSLRDDLLLYLFSSSTGFALSPHGLNMIFGKLWLFISKRSYVFLLFGLLLWRFDFPGRGEKNWIPLVVALALSFIIYFSADEEFTIEVYDPSRLGHVPYGIEVIQKDLPEAEWEIN